MAEVCHTCPLWTQVRGKHPQSNEEIDRWDCSLAWLPMLLVENAQQSRQTGAAVDSFRNAVVNIHNTTRVMPVSLTEERLILPPARAGFFRRLLSRSPR